MPKVVITLEPKEQVRQAVAENISSKAQVVYLADLAENERAGAIQSADVLLFFMLQNDLKDAEKPLISDIPMLQSIPAGVEHLPFEYISPNSTLCANAGAWAWPLAEYVMGMLIFMDRDILGYTQKLAQGFWNRDQIRGLRGRTLGIIGFGGIGKATARLARAFGLKLMAINRSGKTDEPVDFIGTEADMDKVLSQSDFVLLCSPLTKTTRGMINAAKLGLMKDDAILINVGRGPLVDEDDLYGHLKNHPDFKFGSDVWWNEPPKDGGFSTKHPIFDLPNVMGTPHNADLIDGMLTEAVVQGVQNVNRYIKGEPLYGVINQADYV